MLARIWLLKVKVSRSKMRSRLLLVPLLSFAVGNSSLFALLINLQPLSPQNLFRDRSLFQRKALLVLGRNLSRALVPLGSLTEPCFLPTKSLKRFCLDEIGDFLSKNSSIFFTSKFGI